MNKNKVLIYLISCLAGAVFLHIFSFQVYDYKSSPFSFIIILLPSVIGSYLLKDAEHDNGKDWIFNTLAGLLVTIWPTIIIVVVLKYFFSFIS